MEVLKKLRSTVSSALPGNPLSKDFDVTEQIASGGSGLVWKIYNGVKKTTKQEAAVFVFEKKLLEKYSRRDKEIITESLKKGVSQLTRLRHPKILSVLHPLEESRETLAFATEPVFASLANVLGNHSNLPSPIPKQITDYNMYEVEIKHGLLQIAEGLGFLHNDVKLLHSNICPETIVINKNGTWKLAGFDCCVPNANPQEQHPLFPFREWDPELPPLVQPNLDYFAPEYALTMSCSLASDMFSVGVLIYTIFNNGKPVFECRDQLSQFRKFAEEVRKFRSSLLGNVPEEIKEYVKMLLNAEPTVRPDPDQLSKIPFFQDVGCMTLTFMDSLYQRDNLQKSQFFKGLPKIIVKLPKRVNIQRILPALQKECLNHEMVPFVLPNILQIAEQATDKEFITHVLPILKPLFKIKEPIQILLIFIQNMNLLLKKTPQSDIRSDVLPMIFVCLETDSPQLQELCLNIVPTFADLIEFNSLKNSIVPRIKKLCLSTSVLAVRINCLLCIGKLLEYLDKWTVLDDVLPILPTIPSREPAVLMSILGIYQVTMTHAKLGITKDMMATKILPFIIPASIDNNLNLAQFNAYMTLIRDMLGRMEKEQRSKLEQIDLMKQEQKTIEITKVSEQDEKQLIKGIEEAPQSMMDKFLSGFGMGSMFGSATSKSEASAADSSPASVTSSLTDDKPTAASPVPPPSKTLSLEEKQRLAKQQEQQRIFKSQKPLNTNSSVSNRSTVAKQTTATTPKVKDLTSSLMNTNFMGASSSSSKTVQHTPMPNYTNINQTSGMLSSGSNMNSMGISGSQTVTQQNIGFMQTPMNMSGNRTMGQSAMVGGQNLLGMQGGMGHNSLGMSTGMNMGQNAMGMGQSSTNFSGMNQNNQSRQKMDLSAFDSLLPGSNPPKPSLSQMAQSSNPQQMTSSNQWGMMGNNMVAPTGSSQRMMGMQMGQNLGNPRFGVQNPNVQQFGQPGSIGQRPPGLQNPMQPMGSQNFQQPQPMSNSSSSNDLADIFG